jgi:hypothetical protein
MKKTSKRRVLLYLLTLLCFTVTASQAQPYHISGEVKETFSQALLPFVHIIINDGDVHKFTDANGGFSFILNEPPHKLEFFLPLHRSLIFTPEELSDSLLLKVSLNRNKPFVFEESTNSVATTLMAKVLANKISNSPYLRSNFSYDSYNKLTITTEDLAETKNELQKLLGFFKVKLKEYNQEHHLFLMESATTKNFLNKHNQKEELIAAKASGLDYPSLLTLASLKQPFSIYENYLNIAGEDYISPLAGNALRRYNFTIIDTAFTDQDTIYVVKYNPASKRKLDKLIGLLYISSRDHAVRFATARPATQKALDIGIMQEYKRLDSSTWFPVMTKAQAEYAFATSKNIRLVATTESHINNVQLNRSFSASHFDEVVIDYPPQAARKENRIWEKQRQLPLTVKDHNTYAFYDSIGSISNFQRLLKSGHKLYYGHVPINKFTIDLNRLLSFNEYEGIRAGFGGYTNNLFSRYLSLGAYYGYGFNDKSSKYGANASILISPTYRLQLHGSFSKDLAEPGAVSFAFNKPQYSAEPLRKYRLHRLDKVYQQEVAATIQPYRNLYLRAGIENRRHELPYPYQFMETATSTFNFTEFISTLRYSMGEKFIRSERDLYSLGTTYPEFWLQYAQGIKNSPFSGQYSYQKLDFKAQQSIRILGFGKSGWQLTGGIARGSLPYPVLYNARGSYRIASIVSHNSFETMHYNEFLSDRHIALFYSHNFGRIYERSSVFRPNLEMLHNIGFGWLRHPGQHRLVAFKTMEKGFFETGFFTSNLYVFNLLGLKAGIGAGMFLRYGPYAFPTFNDNLIFKFATNFHL